MRISGIANLSFGKLEKGIKKKCKEDYRAHCHEGDSLYFLWHNAGGLKRIENSDVVILKDSGKKDDYGHRIFSLEAIPNDTVEIKKPLYRGNMFDFLQGYSLDGFKIGNDTVEKKIQSVETIME